MKSSMIQGVFMFVAAATALPAQALVVDPSQSVSGSSQLALAEQWVQWALGIPAPTNPLLDATGTFARVNNNGPVFFLAGNATGGPTERSFNVTKGKPIFFPVVNAFDLEVPTDGCDVQCALGFIPGVGGATELHATLDGQDLLTFPSYRQTSTALFTVDLPPSLRDAFGFPQQYVGLLDAVTDGYWVALDGLTAGAHTLVFGGTIPELAPGASPFSLRITANINVVPEPQTYPLLLTGLAVVGWLSRRKAFRANEPAPG